MERSGAMLTTNKEVKTKILELYDELFSHDGYGEVKVEMRILQRRQKEIIIHCGKQYRFVVDCQDKKRPSTKK
jgi:hypothetical protein